MANHPACSRRGAREDWQITEKEARDFIGAEKGTRVRGFEVVRETVIHVENFPVDY